MSFLTVEASTAKCTKNKGVTSYEDIEDLVGKEIIRELRKYVVLPDLTFKVEDEAKIAHQNAKDLLKFCLGDEFTNIKAKREALGPHAPELIERKDGVKGDGYYQILGVNDPFTINRYLSGDLLAQTSSTEPFWSVLPWSDNETKAT